MRLPAAAALMPLRVPEAIGHYTDADVVRACACAVESALARRAGRLSRAGHWLALVALPFGLLAWMVLP